MQNSQLLISQQGEIFLVCKRVLKPEKKVQEFSSNVSHYADYAAPPFVSYGKKLEIYTILAHLIMS